MSILFAFVESSFYLCPCFRIAGNERSTSERKSQGLGMFHVARGVDRFCFFLAPRLFLQATEILFNILPILIPFCT